MDIVIGVGTLLGFSVSENFKRPFAAGNFLDCWSRWHITLSNWFKTYLFQPVLGVLVRQFGAKQANYLGVLAFFFTFLIMGIWHGSTPSFVVYGILLGGGVSLNRLYIVIFTKYFSKKTYAAISAKVLYRSVARAMMIAYFAMSLTCIWMTTEELTQMYTVFQLWGLLKLYVVLTLLIVIATFVWDTITVVSVQLHPEAARSGCIVVGLSFLFLVWSDANGFRSDILTGLGFALPSYVFSVIGGLLLMFGVCLSEGPTNIKTPTRMMLSTWAVLVLLVSLVNVGAVPDFVYKGY